MKLLIESGATKSTWVLFNQDTVIAKQVLSGINPTSNPSSIEVIESSEMCRDFDPNEIIFYGAGVSNEMAIERLRKAMYNKMGNIELTCFHDVLAAARAISYDQPSIVSILGTGSNSVVFDGHEIVHAAKSLGYIFSDFGSGYYIGKLLVQRYFQNGMTDSDQKLFFHKYIENKGDLIAQIYSTTRPNFFIASLSKFLQFCSHELKASVLDKSFHDFFINQIVPLPDSVSYKLNFVGTISKVFEKELALKAAEFGYSIAKICADPIEGLVSYHQKNYN